MRPRPPTSTLFPYTTLFRSVQCSVVEERDVPDVQVERPQRQRDEWVREHAEALDRAEGEDRAQDLPTQTHDEEERREDRKSTRLNSSHVKISYAVFCLKKKK